MTFIAKLKWVLGILLVFIIILATNLIDRHNFNRIHNSVVTIYEDRLIASDLILEVSRLLQEKELAMYGADSGFYAEESKNIDIKIEALLDRYDQTRLTLKEKKVYDALKQDLVELRTAEDAFVQSGFKNTGSLRPTFTSLKFNLKELSKIQLSEGSRQMGISQKAIDSLELFTHLEIYVLLLLAVLIQIIVMYKPKQS